MKRWRWSLLLLGGAALVVVGGPAVAATGKSSFSHVRAGARVVDNAAQLKAGAVVGHATVAAGRKAAPAAGRAPSGFTVVSSATLTNLNGAQSFGSVNCPSGLVAWGGGTIGSSTSTAQNINSSYPLVSSGVAIGWAAYLNNASGSDSSFTVYAVCAAKPKKYSVQSASFTDNTGVQTSGSVVCPIVNATTGARSKALGGGAFGNSSSLFQNINTSIPANKNTWRVDMNNASGTNSGHTVYVICGKRTGYGIHIGAAVTNLAGHQTNANVSCPSGKVETGGGGYSSSGSTSVSMNSTYPFSSGWGVYENNATSSDTLITPYAVCVG